MQAFLGEAREWARGRMWIPRALLLLVCAWIFYRHLQDPMYGGIVKGLNLAIHEIGHVLFGFVGEFIGIAGGTILQLAAPIIAAWLFYRQRDFFAIAIALVSTNTAPLSAGTSNVSEPSPATVYGALLSRTLANCAPTGR